MTKSADNQSIYMIVIRDINGKRFLYDFNSRGEFYSWTLDMCTNEDCADNEYEILLIRGGRYLLYNALVHPPIDWEDLLGFLA